MASVIEKLANICLIIACTVVVGESVYRRLHTAGPGPAVFASGEHIQGTSALALSNAPRTLIVSTTSTCPYCKASMPSYKEVTDLARKKGIRVVAVTGEAPAINQAYLASHGIATEKALSQPESGIQVPRVPSLILVRSNGTVIDAWTGMADNAFKQAALKALAAK